MCYIFNAAQVGDAAGSDLFDDQTFAGIRFRFSAAPRLGSSVIRFDFTYPLDDNDCRDYSSTVSAAVGQVSGVQPVNG